MHWLNSCRPKTPSSSPIHHLEELHYTNSPEKRHHLTTSSNTNTTSLASMAEPISSNKTLHQIAVAFKSLINALSDSQSAEVEVSPFSHACSKFSHKKIPEQTTTTSSTPIVVFKVSKNQTHPWTSKPRSLSHLPETTPSFLILHFWKLWLTKNQRREGIDMWEEEKFPDRVWILDLRTQNKMKVWRLRDLGEFFLLELTIDKTILIWRKVFWFISFLVFFLKNFFALCFEFFFSLLGLVWWRWWISGFCDEFVGFGDEC